MKKTKLIQRKTLSLSRFRGVDLSSQVTEIKKFRASNMLNLENHYGVNHKRHGWTEIVRALDENGVSQEINGIFDFNSTTIVYAGTCFYKLVKSEGLYSLVSLMDTCSDQSVMIDDSKLLSNKTQMFILNGIAYFVGCGDFLTYGEYGPNGALELRRVLGSNVVYIPVTTKHIKPEGETDSRETYEVPNVLTKKRKNWLFGNQNASNRWILDTKIENNSNILIELNTSENGVDKKYIIENVNSSDKTKLYKTTVNGQSMTLDECGSVDFSAGSFELTCSTAEQIQGLFNMEVIFEAAYINPELIAGADFGVLFSLGASESRLFVSGENLKNLCLYSNPNNPLYFEENSKIVFGSDTSNIMGFSRINGDTLAVFKEYSSQEPNIYYVSGKNSTPSIEAGTTGFAVTTRHACEELAGENLVLTNDGVYAISLMNNLVSTRTFKERSRLIREKLKGYDDLSNACAISFNGKYYLAIDGDCFVADSAFKASDAGDLPDGFGYEWWLWSNVPARVWFSYRGKLYFGTKNGQVCVFDDNYSDREFEQTCVGDLLIDVQENAIIFNSTGLTIRENDKICFNDHVIVKYLDSDEILSVDNNKIKVLPEKITGLINGTMVFAENVTDTGLQTSKLYFVENVDVGSCTFCLENEDGETVNVGATGFSLVQSLKGKEVTVTNIFGTNLQLSAGTNSENVYVLTSYLGNVPANVTARISNVSPVCAEWQTPVFDMGECGKLKTLLNLSVATEKTPGGMVQFGFETKNISKQMLSQGVRAFNFALLNFEDFSFDCGFVSSFSVMTRHKFNYIIFHFKSDNSFDCVVTNLTATYKVGGLTKGVK